VLAGTSGGIDTGRFGASNWRQDYERNLPESAPRWFVDDRSDVEQRLSDIRCPALLLWGENDAISPPVVGRYLAERLPSASFCLVTSAGHMLAEDQPDAVARHIDAFLGGSAYG
jgi:pimeloyl-ACP methyl ester carboxylesterase